MFRRATTFFVVKKHGTAAALGGNTAGASNKLHTDEKFALAALEYLYEWNPPNDGATKRKHDVDAERKASEAYDRYSHIIDTKFNNRMERLTARMNEALDVMPEEYLEEATLFNSQTPPLGFRLPKQTPPIPGFEPAFGFDVPQLRVAQLEERPLKRPTDNIQLDATLAVLEDESNVELMKTSGEGGGDSSSSGSGGDSDDEDQQQQLGAVHTYPFVDSADVRSLLKDTSSKLDELHGAMRSTVPLTGTSGEEWEAHCALQHRALARQQLILDLSEDPDFYEKFHNDEQFAEEERTKRGILPLEIEQVPEELSVFKSEEDSNNSNISGDERKMPQPLPEMHYAQAPKYHPFRQD